MSARTAWLFPGQGAQTRGMGADLFDAFPEQVALAEQVLGYPVRPVCLEPARPDGPDLRQTQYVQPLLYLVNALGCLDRRRRGEPEPDFLAGHSLGEYNALLAAGCFDFETGLRLVVERGRLMGRADGGGMLAVVRASAVTVARRLEQAGLADVDVANWNCADQLVLAGPADRLAEARMVLTEAGLGRCVPLAVSAAFHSRHMKEAGNEFRQVLEAAGLSDPKIPVISNVTAEPYRPGTAVRLLAEQIYSPVRWWESMSVLIGEGVDTAHEIGPGKVLSKLWTAALAEPMVLDRERSGPRPEGALGRAEPHADRSAAPAVPVVNARPAQVEPAAAPAAAVPAAANVSRRLRPGRLGSAEFRSDYHLRYAYLAGAMYRGIASADLVVRMASAGLMGFLGTGGMSTAEADAAITEIRRRLGPRTAFGVNLLASPGSPADEEAAVRLFLDHGLRYFEAAGFTAVSDAVVMARFTGAYREADGNPVATRHVLAKVSRPEVAALFMAPPAPAQLARLVASGLLTGQEADAAAGLPVSGDVCAEADSGGHTDAGNPYVLMPAMVDLREQAMAARGYRSRIRVGAAGGLGSPQAVAAAFLMGADFVVTGSVNQCSVESGASDPVKDMLADLDVQDTAYAPAGDMFELGARVQVVRKGTLFPARANKLYQLWRQHESLADIDPDTRASLEERLFRRGLDEVWQEARTHLAAKGGRELERCEANPKARMAQTFKWYFAHSSAVALAGDEAQKVNFQIHCGPAMGAFNRFAAGTDLADWRDRHVDSIAERLMSETADLLSRACIHWLG